MPIFFFNNNMIHSCTDENLLNIKALPSHIDVALTTACVGLTFTLKLLHLCITKPNGPVQFLIVDSKSNLCHLIDFLLVCGLSCSHFRFYNHICNYMFITSLFIIIEFFASYE